MEGNDSLVEDNDLPNQLILAKQADLLRSLYKLVAELKHMLEMSTPTGVELLYQSDGSEPQILGDITQIRQVVMNLITNAGDAIGSNRGEIKVSTSKLECDQTFFTSHTYIENVPPDTYANIEVDDNGSGMSSTVV
jgi:two-component system cell cycle sensor histidine kinase/response regulator CckA